MIDQRLLKTLFEQLDDVSERSQTLCLIGASAILLYGHDARQTQDIDVWRAASKINDRELKRISEKVGLDFNPAELEIDKP